MQLITSCRLLFIISSAHCVIVTPCRVTTHIWERNGFTKFCTMNSLNTLEAPSMSRKSYVHFLQCKPSHYSLILYLLVKRISLISLIIGDDSYSGLTYVSSWHSYPNKLFDLDFQISSYCL